jgi:hypothetical protein
VQRVAQQFQVGPVPAEQGRTARGERGEVEHHRQVVGQFGVRRLEPCGPVGGLELEHGHPAPAGVSEAVVGQVQRAPAAKVEGGHVVLGHLLWRRCPEPGQEAAERLAGCPAAGGSGHRVQVIEAVEQRRGRVLQQHRCQLERTDRGRAHDLPPPGNRCGLLP